MAVQLQISIAVQKQLKFLYMGKKKGSSKKG